MRGNTGTVTSVYRMSNKKEVCQKPHNTMSGKESKSNEIHHEEHNQFLTPLEELMLLGIDPFEFYFNLFIENSRNDKYPTATSNEPRIFDDEPEEYEEYDRMLLESYPELKAIMSFNGNRRIYEA